MEGEPIAYLIRLNSIKTVYFNTDVIIEEKVNKYRVVNLEEGEEPPLMNSKYSGRQRFYLNDSRNRTKVRSVSFFGQVVKYLY